MNGFKRKERTRLAAALTARADELRADIRRALLQSGKPSYLDLAGMVHDLGDEAVANELIETDDALIERHVRELRDVEIARQRLAAGSIDDCIDCGGEIGFERLLVYPVAVRCTACQSQHERTYASGAAPSM